MDAQGMRNDIDPGWDLQAFHSVLFSFFAPIRFPKHIDKPCRDAKQQK
jgi:hypothetical protein